MTTYNIEIDYTTGDSFNSYREKELVGIVTTDLDKAKENVRRIKYHYENHAEDPDFYKRYKLKLLTDEGEREIVPFWIGYFETLHGAKIVVEDDPDMAFQF